MGGKWRENASKMRWGFYHWVNIPSLGAFTEFVILLYNFQEECHSPEFFSLPVQFRFYCLVLALLATRWTEKREEKEEGSVLKKSYWWIFFRRANIIQSYMSFYVGGEREYHKNENLLSQAENWKLQGMIFLPMLRLFSQTSFVYQLSVTLFPFARKNSGKKLENVSIVSFSHRQCQTLSVVLENLSIFIKIILAIVLDSILKKRKITKLWKGPHYLKNTELITFKVFN